MRPPAAAPFPVPSACHPLKDRCVPIPWSASDSDLLLLMQKRVPQIKLVDRTFNYDARRADEIWRFILEHNQGSHFHFEIAADLLER